MVLHDLNQACRYADQVIVMKDGRIAGQGPPATVVTADMVAEVFGLSCRVLPDPAAGTPLVVPYGRHRAHNAFAALRHAFAANVPIANATAKETRQSSSGTFRRAPTRLCAEYGVVAGRNWCQLPLE